MVRLLPLRTAPKRGLEFATCRLSRLGERHGWDWLTYSLLQMREYHTIAASHAPTVISAIAEVFPDCRRVVDVGAGSGAFALEAARRGWEVETCEYALAGRLYQRMHRLRSRPLDLDRDPPARLRGPFDLAYCFEVAEHCPPAQGDQLVRFLSSLAPVVVFTAAQPGQGGLGHINEQPSSYWVERFARHGAVHSRDKTSELKSAFRRNAGTAPWFQENVTVFLGDVHRPCGIGSRGSA